MKSRKLKISPIIPGLFLILLSFACSNRPSYVLSEKKMENVLYDIHLAEAVINGNYNTFSADSAHRRDLLNSILKKHKITEAVLDTSLAWYSGHLDKYFKINNNLTNRFTEVAETLRQKEGLPAKMGLGSENRGFFLPVQKTRLLLKISDLPNSVYTFKADTILNRYGGAYELQFNILGISSSLHPVVTLCVQCLDTAFVKRDTISQNGLFKSSIDILQGKQAKALRGSIYFPVIHPEMGIIIQDFTLFHSYQPLSTVQPAK